MVPACRPFEDHGKDDDVDGEKQKLVETEQEMIEVEYYEKTSNRLEGRHGVDQSLTKTREPLILMSLQIVIIILNK